MIAEPTSGAQRILLQDARANYLRSAMLSDPAFLAGIEQGRQEIERGEFVSLEEFERALGIN